MAFEVKGTKNAMETGRTFATLFSDMELRHDLQQSSTVEEFKEHIRKTSTLFAESQARPDMEIKKVQDESFP